MGAWGSMDIWREWVWEKNLNISKKMQGHRKDLGERRREGRAREKDERGRDRTQIENFIPLSCFAQPLEKSPESKVAQSSLLPRSLNGWQSAASPPLATAATGLQFLAAAPLPKPTGAPYSLQHPPLPCAPLCLTSRHSPGGRFPPNDPLPPRGCFGHQRRKQGSFLPEGQEARREPESGIYLHAVLISL